MIRKICIVTGTRAEYGLLLPLMKAIRERKDLQLQLLVTGMHLSPEFGLTYKQIEADGFHIDVKVDMLLSSDTAAGVTKSTGLGMIGFADAFNALQPHWVVILGDRFEAFAAATAAYIAQLPIIHLNGGETTEGAMDEAFRHAITKMSYLHFTATETYRKRVIQLGEAPERVFNVGAIGIDSIMHLPRMTQQELEENLGIDLSQPTVLVTYHPVTLEKNSAADQFAALVRALIDTEGLQIVITYPNADTDGRVIIDQIKELEKQYRSRIYAFPSLGQKRYLSLIPYVKAVVGNSSSGIIEVPSFRIPTLNIGDRQGGRMAAESVIQVAPDEASIKQGLKKALSSEFREFCRQVNNPYGDGQTTGKIIDKLGQFIEIKNIKKKFYDL
ncbi:UDP-N-acetylglucosamine 2-epimerase [Chitinophaga ginsengisoli]|uniref:UDP-N-acetylglucosamine 2-epimerase (Non-hydrolysing)/GDP/UDP-N,N'-diacetylbacillosamine 2-epimerase (Hydrolysing) n=1 Tax=Chitinophaga ginsengisoli TaxID=363837 RepID=A0A2P8GPI0_9BACT|nr:UDP-N-acetylglucosamine 2-epimerase [Chitinophaga ginsengisoli]PSL35866.1 UDP-N-acetylglucosamine 2-epimerase (non-hydrolysing)/GDP/UDP-N,N'-diacetylbacillosamine 2-epimerase (hydrolysing) [Chitinophaga ginsengisoli]